MANNFIFNSPSIKTREIDNTVVSTQSLGITILGLVGETQKGPAFEPTFITNKNDFAKFFGSTSNEKIGSSLKYLLPFYANSYLTEGNQMWVTRVLGLNGYNAGTGWALKVNAGYDPSVSASTLSTFTGSTTFSGGLYQGISINGTGTYSNAPTYVKNNTTFTGNSVTLTVTSYDSVALTGNTNYTISTLSKPTLTQYEDMVVGIVRPRALYVSNDLTFYASSMTISLSGATSSLLGDFTLTTSGIKSESYTATLDSSSSSYLPNVIGNTPKDKNNAIYVEAVYPDLIKKLNYISEGSTLSPTLVTLTNDTFTDYTDAFQTPVTPWLVSELRGSVVEKLFRFISVSDGDSANKEIKISIQRLNLDTREFDVIVRDFNDTDDKLVILESYTRCNLDPSTPNFIGKRIGSKTEGSNDFDFDLSSKFVYVEMAADFPIDAIPSGFEGYYFRNYSASNTGSISASTPTIFYKTSYASNDKLARTYLGISERGYDSSSNGSGINQNLFNYLGAATVDSSYTKTKGFHLDSGATGSYVDGDYTIGEFSVGAAQLQSVLDVVSGAYSNISSRKFTLVPYGGFDGWDVHRTNRTNNGTYSAGKSNYVVNNDYDAYLAGLNKFNNPEEVPMTILATPGLNWFDHIDLVNEAIDLVENVRMDSLYIIDAPDMASDETASDIVDKLDTVSIDTNYAATYVPYIQINDSTSGFNLWIPPTGEVIRSFALSDKQSFVWFANAGVNRGLIPTAKTVRKKFSEPERDILYPARINPIVKFNDIGVDIFGQKTLQVKSSALDRINVRRLLIYAKMLIRQVAKTILFEPNDDVVVTQFLTKTNAILSNIQRERGIRTFQVVYSDANTSETIDRNELYFDINLVPTSTLEYIGLSFILSPSGVVFSS